MRAIKRYGSIIGIKKDKIDEYKQLHENAWPEILKMIRQCNIQNYSIYLTELEKDNFYLFAYFEYTGDDFDADMNKMAADPLTKKWWKLTDPCQIPLPNRQQDQWWTNMEEVFHTD